MSILIKGMEMPKHAGVNEDKDTVYRCYEELKDGYIPDYDLDSAPTIIEAEVNGE